MLNNLLRKMFARRRSPPESEIERQSGTYGVPDLLQLQKYIENGDFRLAQEICVTTANLPQENPYVKFVAGLNAIDEGDLANARTVFEAVRLTNPSMPGVNFALGNIASSEGNYQLALEQYTDELAHHPEHGLTWLNFGVAHLKLRDMQKAKKALLKACDLLENNLLAQIKLSRLHFIEKDYEEAERTLLRLNNVEGNAEAMELLICICIDKKEFDRAIDFINQHESSIGDNARTQGYMGFVYHAQGNYDRALHHYTISIGLDPGYATNVYNLGSLYRDMGRFREARYSFQSILDRDENHAGARWGLSLCMLLDGEYAEGWRNYEMRTHCEDYSTRNYKLPRWQGGVSSFLNLLITAEQGIGDEIMFSSCLPDLLEIKGNYVLECNPKLASIFTRSFQGIKVVGREQTLDNDWIVNYPAVEHALPIGSLPLFFREDIGSFPKHQGYLKADEEKMSLWKMKLAAISDKPKIGISWRGGLLQTKSATRSIPLALWEPILELPVDFISLQYTDCKQEIEQVNRELGVHIRHWSSVAADYEETAALVNSLDLIVSVQTALIHLAGALGAPTLGLISAAPEWRYRAEGKTMPWYPSVSLVRQQELSNWHDVILEARDQISLILSNEN